MSPASPVNPFDQKGTLDTSGYNQGSANEDAVLGAAQKQTSEAVMAVKPSDPSYAANAVNRVQPTQAQLNNTNVPPPKVVVQPYSAPASLTATLNPDKSVTLSWPPISGVTGYTVRVSNEPRGNGYYTLGFGQNPEGFALNTSLTLTHSTLVSVNVGSILYFGLNAYDSNGVPTAVTWTTAPINIA